MNPKLLALYGLKYNPFSPDLPVEALYRTPKTDTFCWRIEHALVREGGFALITGDPGTGKSVALRLIAERLSRIGEMTVGILTRPGSNQADFYRERQEIFSASNSDRITDGAVSSCSANVGSHTSKAPCSDPSC